MYLGEIGFVFNSIRVEYIYEQRLNGYEKHDQVFVGILLPDTTCT